jgi:hypothetical protein
LNRNIAWRVREEVRLASDIGDREPDHLYALHIAGQRRA